MNIVIKPFTEYYYEDVVKLFNEMKWNVPTYNEIRQVGFVAVAEDKVVGFVWCLVGNCKTAYIDYLMVSEEYRLKKNENRSIIGLMLSNAMFNYLFEAKIEKWICYTMPGEPGDSLGEFYDSIGFKSDPINKRYWGDIYTFKNKLNQMTRG